jgi:hypothetical protein
MGQDGEASTEASASIIYYCPEHGVRTDKACEEAEGIGWVTTQAQNTNGTER